MARPDEHPDLVAMGIGEPTCDLCIRELFPQAPDTICHDCKLNPMVDEESTSKFIQDAATRTCALSLSKLATRLALGSLPRQEAED